MTNDMHCERSDRSCSSVTATSLAKLMRGVLLLVALFCGVSPVFAEPPREAAEVQDTVKRVMSDPEFRHLEREIEEVVRKDLNQRELPNWFTDAIERFFKWLFSDESKPRGDPTPLIGLGQLFLYVAIGLVVALLVFLLVNLLKRFEPTTMKRPYALSVDEEAINPTVPPGENPPSTYEARAIQFAHAGDYRSGLRELVLGCMSWTERAGKIRHRRGLTNRDYIRAVWREVERRQAMLQIVEAFELVFYGRREAEESQFERCLAAFQSEFRESVEVSESQRAAAT